MGGPSTPRYPYFARKPFTPTEKIPHDKGVTDGGNGAGRVVRRRRTCWTKASGAEGLSDGEWVGCAQVLDPTGYIPKPDTKVHRTLVAPKAELGWYCYVWAIERGRKDLVEKISHTNPWSDIPVVASLLADWSDPWILVTVCHFMSKQPYQVIEYSPALPGRVPFVFVPDAFEGTWLEQPGSKWRPGEPYPKEWLREAEEYTAR